MAKLIKPLRNLYKTYSVKRLIKTVIIFLLLYFSLCWILFRLKTSHEKHPVIEPKIDLEYAIVHLDFKGAPPKLSYLDSLLPILREQGANGLLIEYEDMFPFDGDLEGLSSENCYKKAELSRFLMSAMDFGFEIIPLVQTFGHLEYVLKHDQHAILRENPNHSDSICPTQDKSKNIIKSMLFQILDFHTETAPVNYIHIGCDEVFHINECSLCKSRNVTKDDIFLQHVSEISAFIKATHPKVHVLIWDDMLRHMKPQQLKLYNLQNYVEPVYWDYTAELEQVTHSNLYKYYLTFHKSLWIASAFKGADDENAVLPNLRTRFRNHYEWMKFIKGYNFGDNVTVTFRGIFLTGWSKYNHFKPLCELFAASVHSLSLGLVVVNECKKDSKILKANENYHQFYNTIEEEFRKSLYCQNKINLENFDSSTCYYGERHLYPNLRDYLHNFTLIKDNCNLGSNSTIDGVNDLSKRDQYEVFSNCLKTLQKAEDSIVEVLKLYYEDFVINDYMDSKIGVYKAEIYNKLKILNKSR